MTDPRGWKKRIIFEEAPRFFGVPGGEEIVASSYATYRKYATWLVTVCQQMEQIPEKIRPVLFGNSQTKIVFRQKSSADLGLIASELKMPQVTVEAIRTYPSPEHLPPHDRYSACTYWAEDADRAVNGTLRIYASPEMLYCSSSDGDLYEERSKALRRYDDVTEGILEETARKRQSNRTSFMKRLIFTIPLLALCSCSATNGRKALNYGLGAGAGTAAGYGLSAGDPLWTAAGTAGGIALAAGANALQDKENEEAVAARLHRRKSGLDQDPTIGCSRRTRSATGPATESPIPMTWWFRAGRTRWESAASRAGQPSASSNDIHH